MSTQFDLIAAIDSLVKGDEHPLGEPEKMEAVDMALAEHSRLRPHIVVEDEAGTGAIDYALTLLASWFEGLSAVKTIEYPVDDDGDDNTLQEDAWKIYAKPSGKCIRFLEDAPATTESFRVTYTALHTTSASACTVPDADVKAVQMLAAAYFCSMLASYYSQTGDSAIAADSVDHRSKAAEYASRARMWRGLYFSHLGVDENKTPAASVTRDQDMQPSWRGDKLTHPNRYR